MAGIRFRALSGTEDVKTDPNTRFEDVLQGFHSFSELWGRFEIFDFFDFWVTEPSAGGLWDCTRSAMGGSGCTARALSGTEDVKKGPNTRFGYVLQGFHAFGELWGRFEIFDFFNFWVTEPSTQDAPPKPRPGTTFGPTFDQLFNSTEFFMACLKFS